MVQYRGRHALPEPEDEVEPETVSVSKPKGVVLAYHDSATDDVFFLDWNLDGNGGVVRYLEYRSYINTITEEASGNVVVRIEGAPPADVRERAVDYFVAAG